MHAFRGPVAVILGLLMLCGVARAAGIPDSTAAPMEDGSYVVRAQQRIDARDYASAIPLLQAALKQAPDDPDALNLLGFSLRKTGRLQEAMSTYDAALKRKPLHLGANEYLGELYVELQQLDKAKERLAVLLAACSGSCDEYQELQEAISKAERR